MLLCINKIFALDTLEKADSKYKKTLEKLTDSTTDVKKEKKTRKTELKKSLKILFMTILIYQLSRKVLQTEVPSNILTRLLKSNY